MITAILLRCLGKQLSKLKVHPRLTYEMRNFHECHGRFLRAGAFSRSAGIIVFCIVCIFSLLVEFVRFSLCRALVLVSVALR